MPDIVSGEIWSEVRSDPLDCMGKKCPKYKECHYFKSKAKAAEADIIICNHALLALDLSIKHKTDGAAGILPEFKHLIVDEAHAVGLFGKGKGMIQELGLEHQVFARLVTFGKALGCHGAAILGNTELTQYLINFARSFIYTTALPPHALATIQYTYQELSQTQNIERLQHNIQFFNSEMKTQHLQDDFIQSDSAIHCCIISGNTKVKSIANKLNESGFDVKPILSPTVPKGQERLRFCLHSYNSEEEIIEVLILLNKYIH